MYQYLYKKPSVAASVAVHALKNEAFLMIRRRTEPFKNKYAFPGGYLAVDEEDIYQTAIRELFEETGFKANQEALHLVDIRSNPGRDPRGHVLDVGFLFMAEEIEEIPLETKEAYPEWVTVEKMDSIEFAFDHKDMFKKCLEYINLYINKENP